MTQTSYIHEMRVPYKDTDQMGVVHHSNYINWFETARTEMMRHDGLAYKDMEELGLLLPVLDIHVQYRKPARYDDLINISTTITSYSSARIEFSYEVYRKNSATDSNNEPDLLATGTSLHMWLTSDWKPARFRKIAPELYTMLNKKYGSNER